MTEVAGNGWTNAEGTEGKVTITTGQHPLSDLSAYKKVQFPETVVKYSVNLSGGRNAHSTGGTTEQTVEEGRAIEDVTFTAEDDFHFEDFEPIVSNGVTVRLEDGKTVVSGTPTADVEIAIPDAVATTTAPTATAHVQRIGWMAAVTVPRGWSPMPQTASCRTMPSRACTWWGRAKCRGRKS